MQVYEQVTPAEQVEEAVVPVPILVDKGYRWTAFQAVVAVLVLLAALVLKLLLPSLYGEVRQVYDAELSRSIVITDADLSAS